MRKEEILMSEFEEIGDLVKIGDIWACNTCTGKSKINAFRAFRQLHKKSTGYDLKTKTERAAEKTKNELIIAAFKARYETK